jgi:hypothetical protein
MEEIIKKFYEIKYYANNPTELCQLMNFHGSDKATQNKGKGNYTKLYDFIFNSIKNNSMNILEVGLGTNNTDVLSNMGKDGIPGASLRGWKDYFINSFIYGADVDHRILFEEDRIKTYFVNQLDVKSIIELWKNFDFEFDIILDDGIHDLSHSDISGNKIFFENSIQKLKKGGYYIIEDVACDYEGEYVSYRTKKFVEDVKSSLYGDISYIELLKTPAFKDEGGFRNTQIILIKK